MHTEFRWGKPKETDMEDPGAHVWILLEWMLKKYEGKVLNCSYGPDGFGGLVVSMLASGTQVCGFKPGRSRWIFRA